MVNFPFWFRLFNVALSVFVVMLCVFNLAWNESDPARRSRILGLAILTGVIGWTAFNLRFESFHYRIPVATLGLLLAARGMHQRSDEPERCKRY